MLTSLSYEIKNKKNEDVHPTTQNECTVRKMTDEEWKKYGPVSKVKRKGNYLKDIYCWDRKTTSNGREK